MREKAISVITVFLIVMLFCSYSYAQSEQITKGLSIIFKTHFARQMTISYRSRIPMAVMIQSQGAGERGADRTEIWVGRALISYVGRMSEKL